MQNEDLTSEIIFDEGENQVNRSPYELTKKQIWYKCFQRCFDMGSMQMDYYYSDKGILVSQPDVFINSVNMFYIMALGTLMEERYKQIYDNLKEIYKRILDIETRHKLDTKKLIDEHNQNINGPSKNKIDLNANIQFINVKFKNDLVSMYKEKLAGLSILMENERYLDSAGGIND